MSFAFGLAVFGTALAVGLRTYLAAAADETGDIRERIAMESAAAAVLGELAAGASSGSQPEFAFGAGRQSVLMMLPGAKVDPGSDAAATVAEAGRRVSLTIAPDVAATARGLVDLSRRLRLSAGEEDCLRRAFTYGRQGAPRIERPESLKGLVMRAGDQVDLRIQSSTGPVLWVRARFTGGATGWRLHDYRRLQEASACR